MTIVAVVEAELGTVNHRDPNIIWAQGDYYL